MNLVMTHRHGVDAEPVHPFAWDTFVEMADYMCRMGPFEPGRLPMEDTEYTTMPQVAERMHEHWEPIEEPEPAPA